MLAALLIDEKNNHEYFGHKYNVSNNIKDQLNLTAKNLKIMKNNKSFFNQDLEKNIYLNDKNHLITLNILNYVMNSKFNLRDFFKTFKKILKSKVHQFPINGQYLISNGMQQGTQIGKVLKKIEDDWFNNNFKISKNQVKEIIRLHSN